MTIPGFEDLYPRAPSAGALPGFEDLLGETEEDEERRRRKRADLLRARAFGEEQAARLGLDEGGEERPSYIPAWLAKAGRGAVAGATGMGRMVADAFDPLRAVQDPRAQEAIAAVEGVDPAEVRRAAGNVGELIPSLSRAAESAQEADQEARDRLAEASVDLPTPLAVAGAQVAEMAGIAADPLELLPGGLGARGATAAARALRRAPVAAAKVPDDLAELARVSQEIGASPPATRQAARIVDTTPPNSGVVRQLDALDEAGERVGSMTYSIEPAGGFRVMDIETGARGTGGMRGMMRQAMETSGGPYKGSLAETDEGAAALARLRETDPEIFGERPLTAALGDEAKLRPPDDPFQFNAASLDAPADTLQDIRGVMRTGEKLAESLPLGLPTQARKALQAAGINSLTDMARYTDAQLSEISGVGSKALAAIKKEGGVFRRRRTGIEIEYERPDLLQAQVGMTEDDFLKTPVGTVFNREQHALLDSYIGRVGQRMEALRPKVVGGKATMEEAEEFTRAKDRWTDLLGVSMAGRTEAGRTLESFKHLRTALDTPESLRAYLVRKMGCPGVG